MYKVKILDCKTFDDREWMLCKGNLAEYLESLKEGFYNFSIQRKIVKNQYLDSLITTIKDKDPIPLITLTYDKTTVSPKIGEEINIDMNNVEILDGLQRTFRLWAHDVLINEFKRIGTEDPTFFAKEIKAKYPVFFDSGIVSLTKIKNLFQNNEFQKIKDAFLDFEVYFIMWVNLSPKKVIHKMLVLNAGQRSVSTTHQFELLFLYLWEDLQNQQLGIRLFREKDPDASKIKSGVRNIGDYMFTSVIVGLRSYLERKALRVSMDDLDVAELSQDENNSGINEEIFNPEFIKSFLNHLKQLDEAVTQKEGAEEGKKWFVKDTTLSGILAGLGMFAQIDEKMPIAELNNLTERSFATLLNKVYTLGFNLTGFTQQYNLLSSRSVNIGSFIRKVIMHYTVELLEGKQPSWDKIFNAKSEKL
jgi:hypothetical protein